MNSQENAEGAVGWPSRVTAWSTVAILFVAYIASFIDRTILSLLVDPIKASLAISDIQIGMISGLAFGVLYSVLGLPLGWLADRHSRRVIISIGIGVWSLATAGCGLARSFGWLFAARMAVGIGEAALAPAALSLIADSFPPERRAVAISVFVMAGSVGAGSAMILGGHLIGWLGTFAQIRLPLIGYVLPWQAVFMAVGLPGLLISAAILLIREPPRRGQKRSVEDAGFARATARRWRVLVPTLAAMTLLGIISYGLLAWLPSFFIRTFNWTAGEVGLRLGVVFLVFGSAGAVSGGWLAAYLGRKDQRTSQLLASLRIVALGLTALALPAAAAPLVGNGWASLLLFALVLFLFAFPSGAAVAAVQTMMPDGFRARTTALYYVVMNLFGLSIGAVLVGALAQSAEPGRAALAHALSQVGGVLAPIAAAAAWLAVRVAARGVLNGDGPP